MTRKLCLLRLLFDANVGGNQREIARQKHAQKQKELQKKAGAKDKAGNKGLTLEERRERFVLLLNNTLLRDAAALRAKQAAKANAEQQQKS